MPRSEPARSQKLAFRVELELCTHCVQMHVQAYSPRSELTRLQKLVFRVELELCTRRVQMHVQAYLPRSEPARLQKLAFRVELELQTRHVQKHVHLSCFCLQQKLCLARSFYVHTLPSAPIIIMIIYHYDNLLFIIIIFAANTFATHLADLGLPAADTVAGLGRIV